MSSKRGKHFWLYFIGLTLVLSCSGCLTTTDFTDWQQLHDNWKKLMRAG